MFYMQTCYLELVVESQQVSDFTFFANSNPAAESIYFKSPILIQWLMMATLPRNIRNVYLLKVHLWTLFPLQWAYLFMH